MHAGTVSLHDGGLSIHIDDQTRQKIALAMHQTIGIVVGTVKFQSLTERQRFLKPAGKE